MQGLNFYLQYPNAKEKRKATRKNLGNHSGNVVAVPTCREQWWLSEDGDGRKQWLAECFAAVQDIPNNPVCGTSCSFEYLKDSCKRISERQARKIHPRLFSLLDA